MRFFRVGSPALRSAALPGHLPTSLLQLARLQRAISFVGLKLLQHESFMAFEPSSFLHLVQRCYKLHSKSKRVLYGRSCLYGSLFTLTHMSLQKKKHLDDMSCHMYFPFEKKGASFASARNSCKQTLSCQLGLWATCARHVSGETAKEHKWLYQTRACVDKGVSVDTGKPSRAALLFFLLLAISWWFFLGPSVSALV